MSDYDDVIHLLKSLSGRANVIPIPRLYITVCKGNYRAAAVLNECVFWSGKYADEDGWFYKSYPQWRRELGIPQRGIETAVKALSPLVERKIVEEGRPVFYRANLPAIYEEVKKATLAEPARVRPMRFPLGDPSGKRLASIQPITQRGRGATAPTPPAAADEKDPIAVFKIVTGREPKPDQRDYVIQTMAGKNWSVDYLNKFWIAWCAADHKRTNTGWLDWAEAGRIPSRGNGKTKPDKGENFIRV